jgi:hypothetical protein
MWSAVDMTQEGMLELFPVYCVIAASSYFRNCSDHMIKFGETRTPKGDRQHVPEDPAVRILGLVENFASK